MHWLPHLRHTNFVGLAILMWLPAPLSVTGADPPETPPLIELDAGEIFAGRLISINGDRMLEFRVNGRPRLVRAGQLTRWGKRHDPSGGPSGGTLVQLADGSSLVCSSSVTGQPAVLDDGNELVCRTTLWGELSLPRSVMRGVVFQVPFAPGALDRIMAELADPARREATVWLVTKDSLSGGILGWSSRQLQLQTDDGVIEIAMDRVMACSFPCRPQPPPGFYYRIGFRDGTVINAVDARLEKGHLSVRLADGQTLEFSRGVSAAREVTSVQVLGGQAQYVSDLPVTGFRHLPFLDLPWPLAKDRCVTGGMLRVGRAIFDKGLGMHSASRATYALSGRYLRLCGSVALDDQAGDLGSVVFRVFVSLSEGEWTEAYTSPVVRGGTPPIPFGVDLAGIQQLALVVDYADQGDQRDLADWLDLRVVPEDSD